jgi:hypothetical protein
VTPIDTIENALTTAGRNVKRKGDIITAQCPAHDDGTASLNIGIGTTRDVVLHCHAGCKPDDILAAIGIKWSDFGTAVAPDATYAYTDAAGTIVYEVVRKPGKKFLQRRPDGAGGWHWNLQGIDRTLYRLPKVLKAAASGGTIYVTEGEKDVERLEVEGVTATCNSGGAGKFDPELARHFIGGNVVIVADRDEPGVEHAEEVAKACADVGVPAVIVQSAKGKDAADHFTFGGTLDDFVPLEAENNDATEEVWPDPVQLTAKPTPPAFPVEVLPEWIGAQVVQVADELQAPVDLPAQLAITALSIAASKRYKVHIRATWYEPLCTYLATALDPTVGKSPAVTRMLKPIKKYEQTLIEATAIERQDRDTERKIIEKAYQKAVGSGDSTEAKSAMDELRAKPDIPEARLVADDITPEKLAMLMASQGGRLAIVSTEGDIFNMMAGKYKDAGDFAIYLKSWSADDHVADRVNRESVLLPEAHLTIGVTIQPGVLKRVAANIEMREIGLSARFMFSIPTDSVGYRDLGRASTWSEAVEATYNHKMTELVARLYDIPEVRIITMSAAAHALFTEFRQDMETRRRRGGELEALRAWSGKMESTVVRAAALFHLADGGHPDVGIDVATMRRAIVLGFYWIGHAKLVEDLWDVDPELAKAERVLDSLAQKEVTEISLRDVYKNHPSIMPGPKDAVEPLQILTERGWLRPLFEGEPQVGRRGVDSPKWAVHPRLSHFRNNHGGVGGVVPKESNLKLPTYLLLHGEGSTPQDNAPMTPMTPNGSVTPTDGATTESDSQPTDPTDPYAIALAEGF